VHVALPLADKLVFCFTALACPHEVAGDSLCYSALSVLVVVDAHGRLEDVEVGEGDFALVDPGEAAIHVCHEEIVVVDLESEPVLAAIVWLDQALNYFLFGLGVDGGQVATPRFTGALGLYPPRLLS